MTTIAAVRKDGIAAIAADGQVSQGGTVVPGTMRAGPSKIHAVANGYVGVSGSVAHHSVLRSLWYRHPELFNLESTDAVFETFRAIQPILRDDYFVETSEDDDDQEYESNQMSGLIISPAGIFSFFSYREISEYNRFWAAGSGTEYALGAMDALYEREMDARSVATLGVTSAAKFDQRSGLPVESFTVRLND